jgi:hypothetical protein
MMLRRFSEVVSLYRMLWNFRWAMLGLMLLASYATAHLWAQGSSATINGLVTDPKGRVVPGADVQAVNIGTNVVYPTKTNDTGIYSLPNLPPGPYRIVVRKDGFKEVNMMDLDLHTQDVLEQNFALELGSVSESVTVNGSTTNDSPAVSMTVDREFVENMPLNGQSFQDLIQLAPGAVSSQFGDYSIDGQRTDSNIFTVDGVSANLGGANNEAGGSALIGGDAPLRTELGTTQSLVSIDALQEFTIQTSGYTAEFGRSPGGQVQLTTRSGSNDLHGSLFDYFRNTVMDANSYSNDFNSKPKTAEHQNDFGGTIGGPLRVPRLYNGKDKTFYFFSYEGLRLLLPNSETEYVPTQAFRNAANSNVQPFLDVAPLPNTSTAGDACTVSGSTINTSGSAGPSSIPCDEEFYYGYSYPSELDSVSLRVDHNLSSRFRLFLRYADTPSSEVLGAESFQNLAINTHNWTAGLTTDVTSTITDDLRINYTRDGEENISSQRTIGGSDPLQRNLVIPPALDSTDALALSIILVPGTSLETVGLYNGETTVQRQYQLIDSMTWVSGKHSLKFGIDWRRLAPTFANATYGDILELISVAAIQQGYANFVEISAAGAGEPVFHNFSAYAQDHWNLSSRFSIDYGLRWEFNPPPGPANGVYPAVLSSSNLATATLSPLGTRPYRTYYDKFAPRFGFAWNALSSQKHPLTIRAGIGIFYDTGQNYIGNEYSSSYPFTVDTLYSGSTALPLSSTELTPPSFISTLMSPYPFSSYSSPSLTMPYTEQWTLSLDQSLNAKNTLTASYVGNNGRKLLFSQEFVAAPSGNQNFPSGLVFTSNASQSSYNALQIQDVGRIASGLNIVGSFTYAHALDNASTESSNYAPIWGNSDNDLRRVLNLALNYQSRAIGGNPWLRTAVGGWLLANRFSTQSGYPLNIIQSTTALPGGEEIQYSPNLIPGVPIYLHGSAATGSAHGWKLNRAAFGCTTTGATSGACTGTPTQEGTLGRNYVRNPSFWALNTSVQRIFPIYEQLHLNFRVDAFNILNHPNLTGPNTSLSSPTFGDLTTGLNTIGAPNSLYAMGAARSLQLSLKLQF